MPKSRFLGRSITREINLELRACPFCNGPADARECTIEEDYHGVWNEHIGDYDTVGPYKTTTYQIGCQRCGASMPSTRWLKTSILKWNRTP